jgi:hypothetical protein
MFSLFFSIFSLAASRAFYAKTLVAQSMADPCHSSKATCSVWTSFFSDPE